MKAVVYEEYAPDDNYKRILKVKDISEPKPKPDEVVFKVKAAALNYNDIWGMRGQPVAVPLPHVSGSDAAGEVIAVGEDVTNFKVGDRVVSHSNISCRVCSACTDGREFDCTKRTIWGFQTGPTVLIMGGGSGVGSFGIQIAKLYNCTVIATASPDKLDKLKEIGADYAVDHRKEDWGKEVYKITKDISAKTGVGPGIDVSFDHIGQTHWNQQLTLLKYGGTLVSCGATTGYDAKTDLRHIFL